MDYGIRLGSRLSTKNDVRPREARRRDTVASRPRFGCEPLLESRLHPEIREGIDDACRVNDTAIHHALWSHARMAFLAASQLDEPARAPTSESLPDPGGSGETQRIKSASSRLGICRCRSKQCFAL
jgi:hypothetical protein